MILTPSFVKGKIDILQEGHLFCRATEYLADLVPEGFQGLSLKISDCGNDNAMLKLGGQVMQ